MKSCHCIEQIFPTEPLFTPARYSVSDSEFAEHAESALPATHLHREHQDCCLPTQPLQLVRGLCALGSRGSCHRELPSAAKAKERLCCCEESKYCVRRWAIRSGEQYSSCMHITAFAQCLHKLESPQRNNFEDVEAQRLIPTCLALSRHIVGLCGARGVPTNMMLAVDTEPHLRPIWSTMRPRQIMPAKSPATWE